MIEKEATIENKLGMHLRAAAVFIETGNRFKCEIYLRKGDRQVNAKSIMGLMTLGAALGSTVTVITHGADEREALAALVDLIRNRFGEKE
ncbi:HPr family phosphocarrier protein [candidate division FCPU426 bacterium]|nr:HPr family phosphocarrier protein [candidate division FCPU426 bacterium]